MPITLTVKDRIAEIVFDVPPVNAFDSETYMSLPAIIKQAAADPEANVILIRGAERVVVPVKRVVPVDATGAGDQFAAGFLFGLSTGRSLEVAGRMGCVAAAEVISHFGARPEANLTDLFAMEGLI